jgi:hypothetical protein
MVHRIPIVTFLVLVVFWHVCCAEPQAIEGGSAKIAAYTLSTRATRPSYVVGSPIWIEITVRNASDHEVSGLGVEDEAATDLFYIAEVRHVDGKAVPPTQFEKDVRDGKALWAGSTSQGLGDHPKLLKPGQSRTVRIDLARRFDLSQPGKYVVQVQRQDDKSDAKIKSNAITIAIVR